MKNYFLTAIAIIITAITFAQIVEKTNEVNDCDQLILQLVRLDKQIESLDKKAAFLNSKETIDHNAIQDIEYKKENIDLQKLKIEQIRSQYCNPNNSAEAGSVLEIRVNEKTVISKEDFDKLSKERQEQILKSTQFIVQ